MRRILAVGQSTMSGANRRMTIEEATADELLSSLEESNAVLETDDQTTSITLRKSENCCITRLLYTD